MSFNRFFLLLFILFELVAQDIDLSKLDRYYEKVISDWEIPGMAIGIVYQGKVIYAKGFGVRDFESKKAVDEHTLFAVASNTKAMTTTALAMLIEEKKLSWHDKVIDINPDFKMYDDYVTNNMRVSDLITHRSGLPVYGADHLWIGNDIPRKEIIHRLRYYEPKYSFRYRYQYQNLMYLTAGELIPHLTDMSWDEFIQKRIFEPLGMTESNTSITQNGSNVAEPYEIRNGKQSKMAYDNLDQVAPAASVNSNVVDMSKWMLFNLNEGKVDDKQLLKASTLHEMRSIHLGLPKSANSSYGANFNGVGYGWFISDYKHLKMIHHSGGMTGMISQQIHIPEKELGVIVLTNHAESPARAAAFKAIDYILELGDFDWSSYYLDFRNKARKRLIETNEKRDRDRIKNTKMSLSLKDYTGQYFHPMTKNVSIELKNKKLYFYYNKKHKGFLTHYHHDTFLISWIDGIFDMPSESFMRFELDEKANVIKLNTSFYHPITFTKVTQ